MKKRLEKIKPFIKYFLIFFFFLFWNLIVQPVNLDEIWNYGFAHSIYRGLIPYRDFNMVITPLFPFIMTSLFHIFGSSMLIFHLEQTFILTIIFYLLNNYLKDKSYLLLIFIIFPLSIAFPSYNMFLFFLFLLIIKLEDLKANDYLIGFILACIILTKQTVGVVMLLPTLFYLKQPKKIIKRFIGCLVPGIIFIIYLILTSSFKDFFNLCILGLFDFASENSKGINIFFILSLIIIGITLYLIKDNKKNIKNYYLLAFSSILIPLFDLYHFEIFFLAFLFILLVQKDIKIYLNIKLFTIGAITCLTIFTLNNRLEDNIIYPNKIKYFEYRYLTNSYIDFSNKINKLISKYNDQEIIFLSADGYYFRIINDQDIGYLDLINTGNFGYNGSSKLLSLIKNKKNSLFFVDKNEIGTNKQTDQKVLKYVIDNGTFIEKQGRYYIYELN